MSAEIFAHNPRTLLHIAPYLRQKSIPPSDIFARAGVSPSALLDANGWVPRELCFKLGHEICAATGDRFLGADIGRGFPLADLGSWGQAVTGASTLRQACETAAKGIGLLHQGTNLTLRIGRRNAVLEFSFAGRSSVDPSLQFLGSLAVLRSVALLAGMPAAVGACFTQPHQRDDHRLEETFGAALSFGCKSNGIVIDREILDTTICSRSAESDGIDPLEMPTTLRDMIRVGLPYGGVTVDNIARQLKMSTRTLQRRLRDWGFSFEEMVDDIRRGEAIRKVLSGAEVAKETAFTLGYSDQAHFIRAFKRWTGLTPRAYRVQVPQSN